MEHNERIRYSAKDVWYDEEQEDAWNESLAEEQQYKEYDKHYWEQHGDEDDDY